MLSLLTCFLALTFYWAPPTDGSPANRYDVHVVDNFGQTVEIASTNSNMYTFVREGRFRVSVRAVDEQERIGPWCGWSVLILSNKERAIWLDSAATLDMSALLFVGTVVQEFNTQWTDPHEGYWVE